MRRMLLALLVAAFLIVCNAGYAPDSSLTGAARAGDVAAVKTLLARGADPNAPAGVNGWPPLMHAIHKNQIGTATALIDAGADVNRPGGGGVTPIMMAAGYGNTPMVELLLSRGANPELADRHGANALDVALTGAADIDRFTLFDCQSDTVRALLRARPSLKSRVAGSARAFARLKRCSEALAMVGNSSTDVDAQHRALARGD